MGRNANTLTGTQQDTAQFEALRAEIKRIGVVRLGSYGMISHETFKNYCRRLPVAVSSESKIFNSIRAHYELQAIEDQKSVRRSHTIVDSPVPVARAHY